ncbi:MAG: LysR family transcriptional regulator [Bdellovibrionales bacterium]|nr:LysR family transcriptional regulator [Bdellovibrionales bacterium]
MDLELVHIFIQVIKSGGFSKAADSLKLPKSTVSKAITRLETETGTKLLLRTTRSQTLTASGKAFYDSCVGPLEAIENAQKSLYGSTSLITGNIKLTAPEDLGSEVIAPAAGLLTQKHPGLTFELIYTDEVLDLVKDGYDLAIRIGKLKESSIKVKKLGDIKLILVASPAYLKKKSKISKLEDLQDHDCLFLGPRSSRGQWVLKANASSVQVSIRPRIVSNQMSSLIKAALAGSGLALVPIFLAAPDLQSQRLVRVLPQWTTPGVPVSLLSPVPFSSSARLRLVTDHITQEVQKALALKG